MLSKFDVQDSGIGSWTACMGPCSKRSWLMGAHPQPSPST